MRKGRKVLIIILIIILVVLIFFAAGLFLYNKKQKDIEKQKQDNILNAEENFKNLFLKLEYTENKNEAITLAYEMEKSEEGKFEVDVNVPMVNIESDTATTINNEINNLFGKKLLDVAKNSTVYTKYSVDYIAYTNNRIMSLIIKSTLKEGSNPQRLLVQTYNYNLEDNTILNLEQYMELNNIDKIHVQSQIINYIRQKSENTNAQLAEEYNIYIRDVRSEEYLIENIKNYYIGQDGKLYIVFAYGNNNFTETVDVIIIQ